jgi:hypothetical protein
VNKIEVNSLFNYQGSILLVVERYVRYKIYYCRIKTLGCNNLPEDIKVVSDYWLNTFCTPITNPKEIQAIKALFL